MKKALYLVAVFGLLLTTACGAPKLKNGEDVIVQIEGKEITANDLYEELKGQYGYSIVMSWIDTEIANKEVETTDEITSYVDEAIEYYQSVASAYNMTLPQFAASYLGIGNVSSEEEVREYITNDRKLSIAIENQVASKLSDGEIEDFYNENYKTTYTYRDIVVVTTDTDKAVKEIEKELKDKKKDKLVKAFEKMAESDYSLYGSEESEVVEASKNNVDSAIWKKLKDMKDYEYASVKAKDGTHVILRISKNKGKDLDEVKDKIKSEMAIQKLEENQLLSYDILTELRNKYKLAFFDEDLKSNYDEFLTQLEEYKEEAAKSNKNKKED